MQIGIQHADARRQALSCKRLIQAAVFCPEASVYENLATSWTFAGPLPGRRQGWAIWQSSCL